MIDVDELPTGSGVYLFKDRRGTVLYVGKAKNLRARVRAYVTLSDERDMVPFLVRSAEGVEVVRTQTEKEALLLENSLIKKHRPRFNVKLRDDSNFLHLRIDPRSSWPSYELVRRVAEDGSRTFGPYASASKARQTLAFLQRAFPLRTCTDAVLKSRRRPCLLHQMGRCVAPCVGLVDEAAYSELVAGSIDLLEGRRKPVVERLRARMRAAADELRFEEAARLRDIVFSVEASLERQRVVDVGLHDRDVVGLYRQGRAGAVAIVPVREGLMGEPRTSVLVAETSDDAELVSSIVNAAYPEGSFVPPEVLVPVLPDDVAALEEVLSERRGSRVRLVAPQRGDKVQLVQIAVENARVRYARETDEGARHRSAMEHLAQVLGLPDPPGRIECFDNSHLSGTNPVSAMAVLLDGRPARAEYRRYRIKVAPGGDDYAAMREVLERRVRRGLDEGNLPDLLVVDGGKGQLGVAVAVLHDLGVHSVPVCGIAKPRTERKRGDRGATDKIVVPHLKDPLKLPPGDPALRILQHVRDEVHRHVVSYQRQVRGRTALQSVLEELPGVGPVRRRRLLEALGSAARVADATVEELAEVPGIGLELARQIRSALDEAAR